MKEKIYDFIVSSSQALISTAIVIIVVIVLDIILNVIVGRFSKKNKEKRRHAVTLAKMLKSIFNYVIIILAIVVILGIWGINIGPVLAGAGILGLVVGLGAQSLIQDMLSGFFIIFENQYDVGDVVEIDGFVGTVLEIGLKSTKLISWLNEVKIIANGEIKTVINYSKEPSVSYVDVKISYKENIDKVINLLEENLGEIKESFPQVIEGPNVIGVNDLGTNGVTIRITLKTVVNEQYAVNGAMKKFIKELFDDNGIEIPYEQLVIHSANNNNRLSNK